METALLVIAVAYAGVVTLYALHQRQERLIAKLGYKWYIGSSPRWRRKKAECFRHYYNRCVRCGSSHNLQCHHTSYEHLFDERPYELVCLCADCHLGWAPKGDMLYHGKHDFNLRNALVELRYLTRGMF